MHWDCRPRFTLWLPYWKNPSIMPLGIFRVFSVLILLFLFLKCRLWVLYKYPSLNVPCACNKSFCNCHQTGYSSRLAGVSGKYFSYFSTKTYVVGTYWKRLILQHMFLWTNKKNIHNFWFKKSALSGARWNHVRPHFFLFLGLRKGLPYAFSPSGKIKFAFPILFLFHVPTLQIWGSNIAFLHVSYFCLKIILFDQPKLCHILFLFLPPDSNFLRNFQ